MGHRNGRCMLEGEKSVGIDCSLIIGKRQCVLDRWYVFDEVFEHREVVDKQEAIRRLKSHLVRANEEDLLTAKEWGIENTRPYHVNWVKAAIRVISECKESTVMFVASNYDDFWDSGFGKSLVSETVPWDENA